eukprot:gene23407-30840_t
MYAEVEEQSAVEFKQPLMKVRDAMRGLHNEHVGHDCTHFCSDTRPTAPHFMVLSTPSRRELARWKFGSIPQGFLGMEPESGLASDKCANFILVSDI